MLGACIVLTTSTLLALGYCVYLKRVSNRFMMMAIEYKKNLMKALKELEQRGN